MVQSRLTHAGQWGRSMQTYWPVGCEAERKGGGGEQVSVCPGSCST